MTWRETFTDQNTRLSAALLKKQGELNKARARIAAARTALEGEPPDSVSVAPAPATGRPGEGGFTPDPAPAPAWCWMAIIRIAADDQPAAPWTLRLAAPLISTAWLATVGVATSISVNPLGPGHGQIMTIGGALFLPDDFADAMNDGRLRPAINVQLPEGIDLTGRDVWQSGGRILAVEIRDWSTDPSWFHAYTVAPVTMGDQP